MKKNLVVSVAAVFALVSGGLLVSAQAPQAPAAPTPQGAAPAGRQGGGRAGGQAAAPAAAGQAAQPAAGRQGGGGGGRGAAQRPRKVVLAWADTRNGASQHAFTSHALAVMERLGYESGLWDTFIRTDSHIIYNTALKTDGANASGGPSLSNVDGIFFLGHREIDLNAKQKEELLAFIKAGHGLVAGHTGLTGLQTWPEWGEVMGAQYGGHPVHSLETIIVEQAGFPAMKHFPLTFQIDDEFYLPKAPFTREKSDVLFRLDTSKMTDRPNVPKDYPMAWVKNYGQGRIFYSTFAHDTSTWDRRDIQIMYLEAMKWALGLTDYTPAPHAMRGESPAPPAPRGGGAAPAEGAAGRGGARGGGRGAAPAAPAGGDN